MNICDTDDTKDARPRNITHRASPAVQIALELSQQLVLVAVARERGASARARRRTAARLAVTAATTITHRWSPLIVLLRR